MKSARGRQIYISHKELDVPIAERQGKWTPMQRSFLLLAQDEYGPDESDMPNTGKF